MCGTGANVCPNPVPSGGGAAPTQSPTKPSTSGGGAAPTQSPTSSPVASSPTCPSCGTAPAISSQCQATNTNGAVYFPSSRDTTITIDGDKSDWDSVINSCSGGMPMYEAGNSAKDYVSDAYTNYDCSTNTLCILVKARPNYRLDPDLAQMWLKVYDIGNSDQPFIDKQMIYDDTNTNVIGWEGCYELPPPGVSNPTGCWSSIQIHANFCRVATDGTGTITACGSTTSTGKKGNGIGIFLECCSS